MNTDENTPAEVHLVCQAHIDPVWIWDWPEGLTETLSTFETAADLLDEYPEFVFNHNESLLYEWTRDYRPELYERIRRHVKDGRWVISGGWYLQPDANLPSGESIARHILIGRRFFETELGATPRVAYNLDTFGHNANMPQFLKLSGYGMYTHFRPTPSEKTLPDFLYRWRGVDGSEIVGFRPPCGWYCTHPGSLVEHKIEDMRELAEQIDRPTTMFWGAGDHGGGATRAELDLIRRMRRDHPEIVHSSFERYYEDVVAPRAPDLPLVTGELQKCFTGCYTSIIGNKRRNRKGEGYALAAERFAALAWWLIDDPYPADELSGIWKDLLFTQFHDILPGSSIREGETAAAEMIGRAVTNAKGLLTKAQLELMRRSKRTEPLTVRIFNPHPVGRTVPAVVDVQLATHPRFVQGKYLAVYDAAGAEVSRQLFEYRRNTAEWRNSFLFDAELPALGLAEYRIRIEEEDSSARAENGAAAAAGDPDAFPNAFPNAEGRGLHDYSCRVAGPRRWVRIGPQLITVETQLFAAAVSRETGALVSLADRSSGRELIAAPSARLIVRADSNNAWGGTQDTYGPVGGCFGTPDAEELAEITGQYGERTPAAPVRVVASGPLAVVVETVLRYKRSVARLRYTFYRRYGYLDIDLLLDWNERRRALQLELATTLEGDVYETEIPHASLVRSRNGGEEPVGRWLMLRSADGALALVNDGPGGVEVAGARIRQTLVRSPVFCSGADAVEPGYLGEHMDIGEHRYRFRLLAGSTDAVRAECRLAADDLTFPFSYHCSVPLGPSERDGLTPGAPVLSVGRVEGDGIVHLEAMKASEDGEALVLRLAERLGEAVRVSVSVPRRAPFELRFRPYEMKTILIPKDTRDQKSSEWTECDLLERPLP